MTGADRVMQALRDYRVEAVAVTAFRERTRCAVDGACARTGAACCRSERDVERHTTSRAAG